MKKTFGVCGILCSLLCGCSNSELFPLETDAVLEIASLPEDSTGSATNNIEAEIGTTKGTINSIAAEVVLDSAKADSTSTKKDSVPAADSTATEVIKLPQSKALLPDAGFTEPFTLPPPATQGIVRCTFDGSDPDSSSQAFSESRSIDSTTVVRCNEYINEKPVRQQTETYFVNETINMPVVSISVDPYYVKEYLDADRCKPEPCLTGKFLEDVEYPTHVEYFANGSSSKEKAFEINAGIAISGNSSRNLKKKSVTIRMRKEYQSGRLHYSLFDTRPEKNSFKAFTLRNNGNRFSSDYIADAMATSLLEGTNVDYQRSKHVVVFYNGAYRGIYDMREKLNEHFIETNYGIDNNNVDIVKIANDVVELKSGSLDDYMNTIQFIDKSNFKDDDSAYYSVLQKINMTSYMEYMAAEIFYANDDWPQANVRAWKSGNSPWKFMAFDIDQGFDWIPRLSGFTENTNMINWILEGGRHDRACFSEKKYTCFSNIFIKLIQNSNFKQSFINRASYLYSTFVNGQKIAQQIDRITQKIEPAQVTRDLALYKRANHENSCGTFFEADGSCLKSWSYDRDKKVRTEFKEAFELNDDVPITIKVKGNGILKLDDFDIKQSQEYNWNVFEHHPMKLSVECPSGSKSIKWEDGSTDPNRVIDPTRNSTYTAECL